MSSLKQRRRQISVGLSRQSSRPCGLHKLIFLVILLVISTMIYNFQSIVQHQQRQFEDQHHHLQALKPLQVRMPSSDAPLETWNIWASRSIYGSHILPNDQRMNSVINFPPVELQRIYNSKPKTWIRNSFSLRKPIVYPKPIAVTSSSNLFYNPTQSTLLTRKGYKPTMGMDEAVNVNQDRVVLVESNAWWWMGLFDGHGELGQIVSQVAALEFSKRISALSSANQNSFQESILKANLKQIYLDVDNALPRSPNIGGSTAISILKTQYNQLVISNLGDSEAFLASFDDSGQNVRLLYETKPHKPDLPQERARIEKMGGEVENPFQPGFSARVVIPIDEFNSMALAMSRSLGDQDGKALGVIAEPDTDVLDLNTLIQKNLNYVVIAATDGLFDHVPPLEVAEHIAKSMTGLPQAAEELILESSKRWFAVDLGMYKYRDDISISIHKLTL